MKTNKPDYSSLFYLNPLPSWVYELDTFTILEVNEAASAHYGYTKEEFLSLTLKDLRPKEDIPKLLAAHQDIQNQKGNIFFGVFTHQKKTGEKIRMEINGHRVDFDGKDQMLIVCRDVTLEEEQLNLLRETENRIMSLSENLPGIIYQYLIHPDGTDSLRNIAGAVEQVWGFTASAVEKNSNLVWDQIKAGGDFEKVKASVLESIQNKSKWNCRLKYVLPTGELRTQLGTGTPSFLTDGTILYNSITLDITQEAKNEELLTQASQLARIGSWEVDIVNQSIFWSPEVHHLHETDQKVFVPNLETGVDFYREDFREMVQFNIQKCIATGEAFDFEAVLVTAKKKEVWVRAIGNGEFAHGECKRIYGSFQDIDDEKIAAKKLQKTFEEKNKILESIGDAFFAVDSNWMVTYWNKEAELVLGKERELIVGKYLWDEYADAIDTDFYREYHKAVETRQATYFEAHYPTLNLWIEVSAYPSEDGLSVYFKDVTLRKKAEEDIRDSEEKRRLIMSGALDAIICIDTKGTVTFWNPQAEVIFGWNEAQVMGQDLAELIVPEQFRRMHNEEMKHYLETGEGKAINVLLELTAIRQSGDEFPIELTILPIKQGGEEFFCAFIRDITQRKKVEQEKNSLQATLEKSLNEIYIFDAETFQFNYANKGALLNLGYSDHEIKAFTPLDLKPDFTATSFKQLIAPLVNDEKEKIIFFTNHKRKDGSLYPVEVHLQLVTEGNNKRFLAIILDITERKKAELELLKAKEKAEDSEAKIKAYTEQSPVAFFTTNVDGECVYANETWLAMASMNIEEALGKGWINALHPDDLEHVSTNWYKSIKTNGKWRYEYRFTNKKGKITWVEGSAKELFNEKKEVVGYLGANVNITERKKVEASLLQSNERFEKVTEATNDAIWDWDIVNQKLHRSNGIEKFFGKETSKSFSAHEFWKDNFHPEDLAKIQDSISEAVANPLTSRWELEYRIFNEFGKTQYVIDRGVIIRDNKGIAVRMVGAMTDISEQKHMTVQLSELNQSLQQYTSELERSNEELEQFAFVASHDLQEPLRMIYSFMDQLKRKYGDQLDPKAHQYIHFATDGAKRMKQIILDLLKFSRANKPTEGKEEVDLNEILSDFKVLRSKLISEKTATIKFKALPTLTTYKAAITQILHSLLDNAIKYATAGTPPIVEINVAENETEWEFSIKDNGIGIDARFYDKIFIIFQRLHNKDQFTGTGIGLSIAKRHVEFLGGRIWLEPAPRAGTIFYFTISKIK